MSSLGLVLAHAAPTPHVHGDTVAALMGVLLIVAFALAARLWEGHFR